MTGADGRWLPKAIREWDDCLDTQPLTATERYARRVMMIVVTYLFETGHPDAARAVEVAVTHLDRALANQHGS
jgi:hypothetical protein